MNMNKRIECIVSGRVQGVLYRLATRQWAAKCGVAGMVCNLSDGTVRVVAEADDGTLKKFIEGLSKGSAFSKVKNVEIVWKEATGEFSDFQVIHGRF
jgi:acylphosphatase